MGAAIVAISVDSHYSHAAFRKRLALSFPLGSDFHRTTFPQWVDEFDDVSGYRGVNRRAVFVVDRTRTVRFAWSAEIPSDLPDLDRIRETIQDLA